MTTKECFERGQIIDGIFRWNSNTHVPFDDVLESLEKEGFLTPEIVEASKKEREKELSEFLNSQRQIYRGPSEEEISEMRSAFGTGTTVVNVITGDYINI